MTTMKDVARAAGVSTATVSATLSGTSYVSPELKARVTAAIESLGYERNSVASGLKLGRSTLIGLVVSDITNPFFTELVAAVQADAAAAGYSVLLGISDHDVGRELELLRLMRSHQAGGTILCPAGDASDYASGRVSFGRMKVVAVDNAAPELPFDTVVLDNAEAAALATRHILSMGHRRVATLAGPDRQWVSRARLDGFRSALAAEGIVVADDFVRRGEFRVGEAAAGCRALLGLPEPPTALFVANNLMLIGVMQALAAAGVAVPGGMAVTSVDDFPWASAFQPALTVVRQPIAEMAAAALDALVARMNGDDSPPRRRVFSPELVVRASCARPCG